MRFFRHTIAEYTCAKHCGYHRSEIWPDLSPFHVITAATATVPWWLLLLREQIPWYYFVSILAGELLLVFLAGFLSSFLLMPFSVARTASCKKCGAPMFLAGRHFDPLGSATAHWSDIGVFVVFVGLNIAVWIVVGRGNL